MFARIYPALIGALFVTFASAALAEITFAGGDGRTLETAIVIVGAVGGIDGVESEYQWLAQNRPGAEMTTQGLLNDGGKAYDALTVQKDGVEEVIYFDITAFFGKF